MQGWDSCSFVLAEQGQYHDGMAADVHGSVATKW